MAMVTTVYGATLKTILWLPTHLVISVLKRIQTLILGSF